MAVTSPVREETMEGNGRAVGAKARWRGAHKAWHRRGTAGIAAVATMVAMGSVPAQAAVKYHFELITKSNASPYWLAVKAGADQAAAKLGDVTVTFEAPASGTDLASQIAMMDTAISTHVDGIILAAQEPAPLVGPVRQALKAGIPVVTVDSGVSPNVADSFLATSNISAGAAICKYGAELAGGKGEYGIIDFNETSSTGEQRPVGCRDGMKSFPGFKYVGMQIGNNDVATGKAETEAMLQANPHINMIFGANDRSALGVAEGVIAAHKTKQVVVVGFD
ncbi:MAG: sugar ABC transporter substrate-binding protein, partial [Acidimicrobiales bacterium]